MNMDDLEKDMIVRLVEKQLYHSNELKKKYEKTKKKFEDAFELLETDIDIMIDFLKLRLGYDDDEIQQVLTEVPEIRYKTFFEVEE